MHTEKREDPLVEMGYETRDVNFSILGKVAFWFGVFSIGSYIVVGIWFFLAKPQTQSTLDPKKPLPSMVLQDNITVREDIMTMRQRETQVLSSYGHNADGSFHIPIDKAIDIVANKGLHNAKTQVPAIRPGNTIPQNAIGPGTSQLGSPYSSAPSSTPPPPLQGGAPR